GGRAPAMRWGQGSLQEIDHVPFVRPLTRFAATAGSTAEIPALIDEAWDAAVRPHSGPAFVDLPLDHVFMEAEDERGDEEPAARPSPPLPDLARALTLLADAERPVIMAGTNLYWGHGEDALRELVERRGIPVFLNGLARGCIPADHELFFSRARSTALKEADLALVIGVPMDFRLGFGASFGEDTTIVTVDYAEALRPPPRPVEIDLVGGLTETLATLATDGAAPRNDAWIAHIAEVERSKRAAEREQLTDDRAPLHPLRVYKELDDVLDRDAIIVGDGGDFVSYAGRVINSYEPGCWLDPGPYGCLGSGPGYALAAKLAHPDRQVILLLGDGAFGFSGMEFDTLARHGVDVVGVMGNNGIWALEHHPMMFLYGYSVAADLRPETRYDRVVEALGGHGALVRAPGDLRAALVTAFEAGKPALVNVLTDPTVAYPRSSNLA